MLRNHPEKFIKISEIYKKNICGGVSLQTNEFFAVQSNFTYSVTLILLYFETLFEILASFQFKLYTLYCN